jgi:hypothetical protein
VTELEEMEKKVTELEEGQGMKVEEIEGRWRA